MEHGLRLDSGTLFLAISMFGFLMAGIAMSARRAAPTCTQALTEWSKAMLAAGGAFLLSFLRGHAPWVLTFAVGNTLVVLIPAFGLVAHAKLFGRTPNQGVIAGALAFGFAGIVGVQAMDLQVTVAIAMLSAAGSLLLGATAILLTREAYQRRLPAAAFGASVAALTAAGFGARAVASVIGDPTAVTATSSSAAQIAPLLLGALFVVGSSMGFLAMVHSRQQDELLEQARRDGLTGVYTRAAFFEIAAAHERRFPDQPCAVVMLDVDHFKSVNDNHGHRGGDLTLSHVARHIGGAVRGTDIVGRYGGEEFCILLPACSASDAAKLANRIVAEAREQVVRLDDRTKVTYTLSAGYAVSTKAGGSVSEHERITQLIERADQALYRAKRSGRDRAIPADAAVSAVANSFT